MHGIISITLEEPDYKTIVEQQVRHYAQKVRLKGFRVGAVPLDLVRKMHGPTILAQELNKIAANALLDYIKQEALSIFIEPLLVTPEQPIDFVHQRSFTFSYELALIDIDAIQLGPHISVTEFEIEQIDDKLMDEFLEGLQLVHGQAVPLEESDNDAILYGTLEDSRGKVALTIRMAVARVPEHLRAPCIGLHVGSRVLLTQEMLVHHFPAFLGLSFDEFTAFSKQEAAWPASFTIDKMAHLTPAPIEPALFDLVLGEGVADSEAAFRDIITKVILFDKRTEARYAFIEALREELFKYNPLDLPEDFLKKWLLVHNPEATLEEIADYYRTHEKSLKWELLLSSIVRTNDLAVTQSDVLAEAERIYTDYAEKKLGGVELEYPDIQAGIFYFLQKDKGKQYAQLHARLSRDRAINFIRQHISVERKTVTAAQFDARE